MMFDPKKEAPGYDDEDNYDFEDSPQEWQSGYFGYASYINRKQTWDKEEKYADNEDSKI